MNAEELENLAKNLANPQGEKGLEVSEMMNTTNISMTLDSINALRLQNANLILEIGQANAGHLEYILKQAKDIQYTGLDISETMKNAAIAKNIKFKNQSEFLLYDGENIPFEDESFDKIFSVNTLYFWKKPLDFLIEIFRVLKQDGTFVLTFGQKKFMKNLPFTAFGFQLYSNIDIISLLEKSPFSDLSLSEKEELITSKTGETVKRIYTVLTIKK